MLVMLLLIHSVKILHAHTGYFPSACKTNNSDLLNNDHAASADCSICNYHLGKDAEDIVCDTNIDVKHAYVILNEYKFSFYTSTFISFFESRGPPSCF